MGYEVNMFLGERRRYDDDSKRDWFMVVATVDLCGPYEKVADLAYSGDEGDPVFMYASDGNRRLVEDCYGRALTAIPAERVLDIMRREMEAHKEEYGGQGYRRYAIAIPLLEVFFSDLRIRPSSSMDTEALRRCKRNQITLTAEIDTNESRSQTRS